MPYRARRPTSRWWLVAVLVAPGCGSSGDGEDAAQGGASAGGSAASGAGPSATGGAASGAGTLGRSGSSGQSGTTGGATAGGAAGTSAGAAGASAAAGAAGTSAGGSGAGTSGAGGTGGTGARACKRGIGANIAPGSAFSPGVGWWYNWDNEAPDTTVEFVPMAWGQGDVEASFPTDAAYLLGFNEPNFKVQANLTPEQAATHWRTLESRARAAGLPLVSPAVNFCGPAGDCNGTDPYAYLKDFFAACSGCQVDHVAVHWYNCDLASLRDYLEPGGSLEGFEQFGKPIWLTEFACAIGDDISIAAQEAYLREAIPYLESKANVFRYAWFSADPIPNAELIADDGSPTALGRLYIDLPGDCHP